MYIKAELFTCGNVQYSMIAQAARNQINLVVEFLLFESWRKINCKIVIGFNLAEILRVNKNFILD